MLFGLVTQGIKEAVDLGSPNSTPFRSLVHKAVTVESMLWGCSQCGHIGKRNKRL